MRAGPKPHILGLAPGQGPLALPVDSVGKGHLGKVGKHPFMRFGHQFNYLPNLISQSQLEMFAEFAATTSAVLSQRFKVLRALLMPVLCLVHSRTHSMRTVMEFQTSRPFIYATVRLILLVTVVLTIPNGTLLPQAGQANLFNYSVLD